MSFTVRVRGAKNLNELELFCGKVWANVWMKHLIYRIDPQTDVVKLIFDTLALPVKSYWLPFNDVLKRHLI